VHPLPERQTDTQRRQRSSHRQHPTELRVLLSPTELAESDSVSCGSSDRDAAAVVGMVAVGIVFAGGVVLAFIAPSARAPSIANGTTIALVIVGVVGSVAAILSSGFVIG
ncbi:hypothetical protein, partial [Cryobacterium sp. TMT3-29-2]|uniref:hypothetical protein n=1 Tax=Cryobacterium sp. TMT3-29-2 TaxID=2555867 RepID=UPI001A7E0CF1